MDINSIPRNDMLQHLYRIRSLYSEYLYTNQELDNINNSFVSNLRMIDTKGLRGKFDVLMKSIFLGCTIATTLYGIITGQFGDVWLCVLCLLGIVFGTGDIGKNRKAHGKFRGGIISKIAYFVAIIIIIAIFASFPKFTIFDYAIFGISFVLGFIAALHFIKKYNQSALMKNEDIKNHNRALIAEYDDQNSYLKNIINELKGKYSWYPDKYMDLRIIDTIIENFECYRADNLKEAFNIIENDRSMQSLMNQINNASLEIQAKQDATRRAIDVNTAITAMNGQKLSNITREVRIGNDLLRENNSRLSGLSRQIDDL